MKRDKQALYIKSLRLDMGWRKKEMARALRITPQFYGRIESGEVSLPRTKVRRLLKKTNGRAHLFASAVASDAYYQAIEDSGTKFVVGPNGTTL